jgi:hypothetical protein
MGSNADVICLLRVASSNIFKSSGASQQKRSHFSAIVYMDGVLYRVGCILNTLIHDQQQPCELYYARHCGSLSHWNGLQTQLQNQIQQNPRTALWPYVISSFKRFLLILIQYNIKFL